MNRDKIVEVKAVAHVVESEDSDGNEIWAVINFVDTEEFNALHKAFQRVQDYMPNEDLAWTFSPNTRVWSAHRMFWRLNTGKVVRFVRQTKSITPAEGF